MLDGLKLVPREPTQARCDMFPISFERLCLLGLAGWYRPPSSQSAALCAALDIPLQENKCIGSCPVFLTVML